MPYLPPSFFDNNNSLYCISQPLTTPPCVHCFSQSFRGFHVVSFAIIKDARTNQDKFKIFLSLTPTLLHKLAVKHGITTSTSSEESTTTTTTTYGIKEKTTLCVRSIEVLRRSGIPFDEAILIHDREGLNQVYGSLQSKNLSSFGSMYTWSNYLISEYFGVKIAVCFAWMHAVYCYLLIPMCGLSLLTLWFRPPVVGHTTTSTTAIGTTSTTTSTTATAGASVTGLVGLVGTGGLALVACAFPVMSMVFLVWWEQVGIYFTFVCSSSFTSISLRPLSLF